VAGGSVSLNLSLNTTAGTGPSGLQWVVQTAPADVTSVSVVAGPALTTAGKTVFCGGGNGTVTCLAIGLNASPIANGVVAIVNFTLAGQTSGPSVTVGLAGTLGATSAGGTVSVAGSGGTITVQGWTPTDTQPPTPPTNLSTGASASQVVLTWTASTDNVGVVGYLVERCLGSSCVGFTQIGTSLTTMYTDAGLAASTSYSYRVRATDAAGNLSSYSNSVTAVTGGDTTPPTVSIASPTSGTTVAGSTGLTAIASDNVAVAAVQYRLDGANLGSPLTVVPYAYTWDTTTASNGVHTLTAVATDTSNNSTVSAGVSVTVNNPTGGLPTQGLIGYWNFDENSGSIAHDTSGNGRNGTVTGAVWTAGKINSALSFNGGASGVVTSNIAMGNTFSLSAWVNPTASTGRYMRIAETQYNLGFYLGTDATGTRYKLIINNGTGATGLCGLLYGCAEGGIVTSGWHLVAATFDGVTGRLYVDGVLVASDTFVAQPSTNLPLYIGEYYAGPSYTWFGSLDEVRLYNRALTTAEVATIFNGGGTGDTTPPTTPTNVAATGVSSTQINVSWTASSDNVGVAGYQIFRNGLLAGTTASVSFADQGLQASTTYSYTVAAYDAAGNVSSPSAPVSASTLSGSLPTQGLIGYWNFDENSGSIAADTSGNGHNGTVTGAVWTAGKINSALSFNGGASGVVTSNIAMGNTFSLSAWVNPTASTGRYMRIAETQYNLGFYLGTDTTGTRYKFIINNGTGATGLCGLAYGCAEGGAVTSGWHLVTATFDGVTGRLYVDGVLVASDTFVAQPTTNLPLYIGEYYAGPFYTWLGALDEVRLYNRALTSAEVVVIFNGGGSGGDTTPPTTPTNIAAAGVSSTQINVSWTASTDNVGVAGYRVFRNGVLAGTTASVSFGDQGLLASTTYSYTVVAYDAAGNVSNASAPVSASTLSSLPTQGLIGYWSFDENSGSIAADTSGNGHNGTVTGAVWTAGKINSALSFNGGTSGVATGNIAIGSTFSVSAWVNPAVSIQGRYARIAETQYNAGFSLGTDATGTRYKFIINNGTGATGLCGLVYGCAEGGTVTSGWHLVTATFDGATGRLYVDGVLVASDTFVAQPNTNLPLYIGEYFAGPFYTWFGALDEVRLYNRALTSAEVTVIFNGAGSSGDTTPPTTPTNVAVAGMSSTQINVSWTASSDNVGVAGYRVFRNGVLAGTTASVSFGDQGLLASTTYSYTVVAYDAAGNVSTASAPVSASTQAAPPTTQGLIGYWSFDENAGSVAADTSGNGHNGTVTGAVWTAGKINSALSFNGGASGVATGNIVIGNTLSVSAWVNPASSIQGRYARIAETQYNAGFSLGTDATGTRYKFIVNNGTGATGLCGLAYGCAEGGAVTSGWHLVTATFDGSTGRLYMDSVLVASDTFVAQPTTNLPLYIGEYFAGPFYTWFGSLDEVRLYNRALTSAEISTIFNYQGAVQRLAAR
jgi:chitodextrinase